MSQGIVAPPPSRMGRWAQGLSIACAIHCLAMPFVVAALPVVGMSFLLDERVETAVLLASLALAAASLWWGFRAHRRTAALGVLAAAATLILAGRLAEGTRLEAALTVLGALALAASQFVNCRLACGGCGCPCHCEIAEVPSGADAEVPIP